MKRTIHPPMLSVSGFTLIEFVIVFSVLMILTSIGIPSYFQYSHKEAFDTASDDFFTSLSQAKSLAASQVIDTACSGLDFRGYAVSVTSATAYRIEEYCGPSGTNLIGNYLSPTKYLHTLTPPLTFSLTGAGTYPVKYFFRVLNGAGEKYAQNGQLTYNGSIKLTGYGYSKTFSLSPLGVVSITTP